ncbi:MAG: FG-GAP repeat protein [Alphaproteobacteria bacterium]|nr:FG-GAP repeat protein [Alphaproteobacteria bacterium]
MSGCLTSSEDYQELYARSLDVDQDGHLAIAWGGDDCDDFDPNNFPGNEELCDWQDNDCDGVGDGPQALDAVLYYLDHDRDGWGNSEATRLSCVQLEGWSEVGGDCDDWDPNNRPYADELCDGVDNDCDGLVDGEDADGPDPVEWFPDEDGDGYGDEGAAPIFDCAGPEGWVSVGGDCDDGEPAKNPGEAEVCSDGLDNDCDGWAEPCRYAGSEMAASLPWSLSGANNSTFGFVDGGGDLDGDGADDLLVGQVRVLSSDGIRIYAGPLVDDSPMEIARIHGSEDHVWPTGFSQFIHPDFNRDGQADLIVGHNGWGVIGLGELESNIAPPATSVGDLGDFFDDYGQLYVFFGPITGELSVDDADISMFDEPGLTVAMAGLTGDEDFESLIVGVALNDDAYDNAGVAWHVDRRWNTHRDFSTAFATPMYGESADDLAGWSVDGDADINGDGLMDILVGAPGATPSSLADSGAAYVVLGPVDGRRTLGDADATLQGAFTEEFAGEAVAMAGDVNGDGYVDVLVGAPGDSDDNDVGVAYLVYGPLQGNVRLSTAEAILRGVDTGDRFGAALEATDLDADGRADLLIGAPQEAGGAGAVHLFYGPVEGNQASSVADAHFTGEPDAGLGWALHAGDDLDGDGLPDAVLGAPTYDGFAGAAYLVPGFGP